MSFLSKIKKGANDLPPRVVAAGPEGVGKSTWASHAPDPLFIAAEDGLTGLEYVDRFTPITLDEVKRFMDEIETALTLAFKSIVVDTADWLERIIHAQLCRTGGVRFIEEYGKGYGKGHAAAASELISLLAQLDRIRARHRVNLIILSHVHIRNHAPPGGEPYDRYEMKGNKGFTGILREWPDACLFMVYETFVTKDRGVEKVVGGERIMHTCWAPGWDAKNRYNLPDPLPLDRERGFVAFLDAVGKYRAAEVKMTDAELRVRIRNLAPLAKFENDESRQRFAALEAQLDTFTASKLKPILEALEKLVG